MAEDNVLGIQATINSSDIDKGVNDYINKITEMEKVTEQAVGAMSGKFKSFNEEILAIASSVEKSRVELEKTLNLSTKSKPSSGISFAAASDVEQSKPLSTKVSPESIGRSVAGNKELTKTLREQEKQYAANAKKLDEYEAKLYNLLAAQEKGISVVMKGNASTPIEDSIAKITEEYEKLRAVQASLQTEIDATNEALANSEGTENIKNQTNAQKEQETVLVKMLGGTKKYKEIMSLMPEPIKMAAENINKMTKAAKLFLDTPLGIALGALILVFKSVQAYLNGTEEGQMKLAKATGFLTGILRPFKDLVMSIGKAFVDAFTNPKQAVIDLWEAIKNRLLNRIEGAIEMFGYLGDGISAALKLDKEGVKEALKGIGNSFLKVTTVVEDAGKKISDFGKKVIESGKEGSNIAVETKQLDISLREWEKKKQQLEARKQQARGLVSNTSLPVKERMAAEKEYEAILDEEYRMELYYADKRIELQKRAMTSGSAMPLEGKQTLDELEAERARVLADYQRELASRQDTNGTLIKAEREALIELGEMEAELIIANQQREMSLLKDGHAKKMKELQIQREQELHAVDELEEKFKKQNRLAGVEVGEDGLTNAQRDLTTQARTGVEAQYQHGVKESLKEELSDVLTYQQRRQKIEEEYAEKRLALAKMVSKGQATQANLNEFDRQKNEAIKAVDEEFANKSEVYKGWLQTISDMTIVQLNRALEQANAELKELDEETADPEKLSIARAKINELTEKIKQLEGQGEVKTRTIDTWKDLGKVLSDTGREFESLGNAIGGTSGKIVSSLGSTFTSTVGLMSNIVQFVDICDKGIMNTAGTAVSAVKLVEASTVILTIISTALQLIEKVKSVAKDIHNSTYESNIEAHQEKINELQDSYDELSNKLDAVFGQSKVANLKEMNENLERQNDLIKKQKEEEADIKQEDEDYEKAKKQYDDAIAENMKQIEANKKAIEEAIFGNDIKAAIEDFANAYADAIANNMDLNESAAEQAKNAMKSMVQASIKEYIAGSEKMQKIRNKMQALYADGAFSNEDQKIITSLYEELNKEIDNKFAWAEEILGDNDSSSSSSSTSKRGIATASQESVDENNGRLMSLQISAETLRSLSEQQLAFQGLISADTATIRRDMEIQNKYISEIVDIQYESVNHLSTISKNTKELYAMNEKLTQIEANTRRL